MIKILVTDDIPKEEFSSYMSRCLSDFNSHDPAEKANTWEELLASIGVEVVYGFPSDPPSTSADSIAPLLGISGINCINAIKNNNEANQSCLDQLEYYSSAFVIFSEKAEDEEFDVFIPITAENRRIAEASNPFTNEVSEVEIEEFDGMHLYIDDGNLFVDLYNDFIGHYPFGERCHRPGFEI